jgi:putative transposase
VAVVQEAYVHGVSTRKVDGLMRALGLEGISKSEVSRVCGALDAEVEAFRTRAITGEHPYVWIDATYHKVRQDGRVIAMATVVAIGVTADGERQVLASTPARQRTRPSGRRFCGTSSAGASRACGW